MREAHGHWEDPGGVGDNALCIASVRLVDREGERIQEERTRVARCVRCATLVNVAAVCAFICSIGLPYAAHSCLLCWVRNKCKVFHLRRERTDPTKGVGWLPQDHALMNGPDMRPYLFTGDWSEAVSAGVYVDVSTARMEGRLRIGK